LFHRFFRRSARTKARSIVHGRHTRRLSTRLNAAKRFDANTGSPCQFLLRQPGCDTIVNDYGTTRSRPFARPAYA
jgi:hypothetical protein